MGQPGPCVGRESGFQRDAQVAVGRHRLKVGRQLLAEGSQIDQSIVISLGQVSVEEGGVADPVSGSGY
jgi:hypothetical protein